MTVLVCHCTTREAAEAILVDGFRDGTGSYMTDRTWSGVWLSDVPLDANEGAGGDALLAVELDLPAAELGGYEWPEEGKPYREFLVPAAVVNRVGRIRDATEEEGDWDPEGSPFVDRRILPPFDAGPTEDGNA